MYTKLSIGIFVLAGVCSFFPLFVLAQEMSEPAQDSLETEIRTTLGAQAVVEGVTPDEFEELVRLLVAQAEQEGITPQDVASAYAPSSEIEYGESDEENVGAYPVDSRQTQQAVMAVVGVLALLGALFAVWRKMEAGGALGSGDNGASEIR